MNYHKKGFGELYDLQKAPYEFDNCWDKTEYIEKKRR